MHAEQWVHQRLELRLVVDDPEVVAFFDEVTEVERDDQAITALRIGTLALQRARGAVDVDAIRRESDRLMVDVRTALTTHATEVSQAVGQSLGQYLHPTTGVLHQRLQQLVGGNGELATVLHQHVGADNSAIARTLAQHFGATSPVFRMLDPKHKDGLVASLGTALSTALSEQRAQIVREFSLDDSNSALSRLIREIQTQQGQLHAGLSEDVQRLEDQLSLDHADSALSRLVLQVEKAQRGIVEQFSLDSDSSALSLIKRELTASIGELAKGQVAFQSQVLEHFTRMEERKRMAATGTQRGQDFEDALTTRVRAIADGFGDLFALTAANTGKIRNCKKGDAVVEIGRGRAGAGRSIVFEAKEDASYTDQRAVAELEEARKNRDAEVGVFVFSRATTRDMRSLRRVGPDILVVWDSSDPQSDVVLDAAYAVATAILAGQDARAADCGVDVEAMEASILEIEKQVVRMQGIREKCESIRRAADTIDGEARKIGENLGRDAKRLLDGISALKDVR